MGIKITIPNTSSDVLTFGSGNTPTAAQIAGIDSGSSNGQLALYTTASGTSTERVRINASGNVGIGTASPAYKLNVEGERIGLTNGNSGAWITHQIQNQVGTAFYIGNESSSGGTFVSTPYSRFLWSSGAYPMVFGVNSAERARIDSSGALLVNATSKISGTTYLSVQGSTDLSNIMEQKNTGTTYGAGRYYQVYWNSSNAVAGGIAHTAATTVAFSTSSDARLKENIVDAPSVLNKVLSAKVRSFDWKEDSCHVQYGFIAQELYEHLPEAVGKGDDTETIENPNGTWQVEYGRLTPMLVKAIQEQQAIITSLTDRITALENK